MKIRTTIGRHLVALTLCTACLAGVGLVRGEIDFGDQGSATLTEKAWNALTSQDLDGALVYLEKCISLYEAEARTMQASLTAFPANEPKEETTRYWALNDVGACYFIKGEVLLLKSDPQGAKAAFETCANSFSYSQCWDAKGWFWKPAEAARKKIVELSFEEEPAAAPAPQPAQSATP